MRKDYFQQAPPILQEFLGYMETIKGRSSKTVDEYFIDLRTFFRYIKLSRGLIPADTDWDAISIADVDIDLI